MPPRRFKLVRNVDASGISGTGVVAEGVCFSSGEVALKWMTPVWSCVFYLSMTAVEQIHGHNGNTVVEWMDDE
jgi:hypothetical protein